MKIVLILSQPDERRRLRWQKSAFLMLRKSIHRLHGDRISARVAIKRHHERASALPCGPCKSSGTSPPRARRHAGVSRATRLTSSIGRHHRPRLPGQRQRHHAVAPRGRARRCAAALRPERGAAIGAMDLAPFWALPRDPRHRLRAADRVAAPGPRHGRHLPPRVLVRTYANAGAPLGRPAARLRPRDHRAPGRPGVLLVGIDTASIDPADSKTLDSHQVIRRAACACWKTWCSTTCPRATTN
jgi:hypothetical protein